MLGGTVFAEGITGLAALWAAAAAALYALYFATGLTLEAINRRHPERRIQARAASDRARDIRQSCTSLAAIAFYVAAGLWLQANGYGLVAPWALSWWSVPVSFALCLVLYDAWFYWFHRLLHWRPLYRFHAQHHRSIAPTPWSNNNDTAVGTFFEQGWFLVAPLLLPIPPAVLIAHKAWDQVTGMIGHQGYEFFAGGPARKPWPMICTTFHDQHHAHFHYNFANTFSFWDRLMGTLHPTYDAKVAEFEAVAEETPLFPRTARQPD